MEFLGTPYGDFRVKAPPQTCQQSIFGILKATHINPSGQTFCPLNMNNRPWLRLYYGNPEMYERCGIQQR